MYVTWFRDVTNGIAAHLANVPRYSGDAAPPTIASASIIEETSSNMSAVDAFPTGAGPFISVGVWKGDESPDTAVNDVGEGNLEMMVRYLTREVSAGLAKQHAGYTLRAAIWSLRRLHGNAGRTTMDDQNDIQFTNGGPIEFVSERVPLGDGFVTGALRIQYRYRDNGLSGG